MGCQRGNTVLDLVGATPVVRLNRLVRNDDATVWAKLEGYNPAGSVKDRISLNMIEAAEKTGILRRGSTIVEPTSGNTGIGLAMVAAVKGYRLILTMPNVMSSERRAILIAYGAKVILTPGDEGMAGAVRKAEELVAEHPDYFMPQQFKNPANPDIHRRTTAMEILEQVGREIDAFVAGVGTGGTITGVGEVLKKELGEPVKIIGVEPADSPLISGGEVSPLYHGIEGIGADFIPDVLNRNILDEVVLVTAEEARRTARRLAREEGLLVGISSGAAAFAALKIAQRLGTGKTVVVILPDRGEKYVSTGLFESDE
ncbi:MAG: cysteine synthase A [Candidatus Tectomicrobia bacterium]|nr:cysteine synthase A [Candidatus Tectomicrobia bacterium]